MDDSISINKEELVKNWQSFYSVLNRSVIVSSLENKMQAKLKFISGILYSDGANDEWLATLVGWESPYVTIGDLYKRGLALLQRVGYLDDKFNVLVVNKLIPFKTERIESLRVHYITPSMNFNLWLELVEHSVNPYLLEVYYFHGKYIVMYDKELVPYNVVEIKKVYNTHISKGEKLALTKESISDAWTILDLLKKATGYREFVSSLETYYGKSFYTNYYDASHSLGKILDTFFLVKG